MQSTTTAVVHTVLAGLLALCVSVPSAAQNSDAVTTVDNLHAALLDTMKNAKTLGYGGRRDRIAPVVEASFDLVFITRFTLGRYWADLGTEQRAIMVEALRRLTIANYASRFDGYSGERFETKSSKPARKGRELVRTVLVVNNDVADNVTLDYLLEETAGSWRIVNVVANGVSDLSLKRADYGAIIKTQGVDSLLARLNGQIADLESDR
ncbi:MAG: ABC transporter substrate-binding protein [Gammaproteobacteria bacterium]|nr:ABC transporter substrate-binding protein [Gammaproteobacteria bacterium]MDX2462291.1 ABC transporter substrate-binding protein [Gammaproteobacteria bacterium]